MTGDPYVQGELHQNGTVAVFDVSHGDQLELIQVPTDRPPPIAQPPLPICLPIFLSVS